MWRLIFLFITFLNVVGMVYPFVVKFDVKFNVIRLKGVMTVSFFNKLKIEFKLRIKHGYVYLYINNKEIKGKITKSCFSFVFIANVIKHLYFREQFINLKIVANFGYALDAKTTALASGWIDVVTKMLICKIKNNKKLANIFVEVLPQYNQDIFNFRVINSFRISFFDLLYTVVVALSYATVQYVKDKQPIFVKESIWAKI